MIGLPKLLSRVLLACGVLGILSTGGCAAARPRPPGLYLHAIQFDQDGTTLDPRDGRRFSDAQTAWQFLAIFNHIDETSQGRSKRKVLIFVHGGLSQPADALDRAVAQWQQMEQSHADWYPLFVIWNSSLEATYGEHLFAIRQGREDADTRAAARFTWPLYLFSDVLRALARAPTVWAQQRHTDDQAAAAAFRSIQSYEQAKHAATQPADAGEYAQVWMRHPRNVDTLAFFVELNRQYRCHPKSAIAISIGRDHSLPSDWAGRGTAYVLTLPFKMLTAPIIDAFGVAAWRNMARRTQTIIEGSSDFVVRRSTDQKAIENYVDRGTDGGLDHFILLLSERAHLKGAQTRPYEITLVGHSMGSMVINELLRRQMRRENQRDPGLRATPLPVKNIVYMAAACSVRDFADSVIPFMQKTDHQDVHFYNLCLHPTAEEIETNFNDLPPRGSLLCWLDDFLAEPATPLDRTLGRWENFVRAPYVVPVGLRGRVSVKAFDLNRDPSKWWDGSNSQPQHHVDFSSAPYWMECFWRPAAPLPPDHPRLRAAEQIGGHRAPRCE